MSLLLFEIQGNGLLRASGYVPIISCATIVMTWYLSDSGYVPVISCATLVMTWYLGVNGYVLIISCATLVNTRYPVPMVMS